MVLLKGQYNKVWINSSRKVKLRTLWKDERANLGSSSLYWQLYHGITVKGQPIILGKTHRAKCQIMKRIKNWWNDWQKRVCFDSRWSEREAFNWHVIKELVFADFCTWTAVSTILKAMALPEWKLHLSEEKIFQGKRHNLRMWHICCSSKKKGSPNVSDI